MEDQGFALTELVSIAIAILAVAVMLGIILTARGVL